jgi:superkiller protein 3
MAAFLMASLPAQAAKKTPVAAECKPQPSQDIIAASELNNEGLKLMEQGDLQGAVDKFIEGEKIAPDYLGLFWNHAIALYRMAKYQETVDLLNEISGRRDKWGDAFLLKGDALFEMEHYEQAYSAYDTALRLDPKLSTALVGMAKIYAARKDVLKAIETLEHAVDLFPADREINWMLGNYYLETKSPLALAAFYRLQAMDPTTEGLADRLALAWMNLDQSELAMRMAEQALKLDAEAANANWVMARVFMGNGDYTRARPYVEALLKKRPDDTGTMLFGLETAVMLKDKDWTKKLRDGLLGKGGEDPDVLVAMGEIFAFSDEYDSRDLYKKALELYKQSENKDGINKVQSLLANK